MLLCYCIYICHKYLPNYSHKILPRHPSYPIKEIFAIINNVNYGSSTSCRALAKPVKLAKKSTLADAAAVFCLGTNFNSIRRSRRLFLHFGRSNCEALLSTAEKYKQQRKNGVPMPGIRAGKTV